MIRINEINYNNLLQQIQERLKFTDKIEEDSQGYKGLDFSGYGKTDDDRSNEDNLECHLKNYHLIQENFNDLLPDLDMGNFKLWSWKGAMWWGEQLNWENQMMSFNGWSTDSIIAWIIINNPHLKEPIYYQEEEYKKEIYRNVTRQDRYEVLKRQKWKCNSCHCRLKFNINSEWDGEVAHIDHVHPFTDRLTYSNGEDNINELENLQGLCPKCNLTKSKRKIN